MEVVSTVLSALLGIVAGSLALTNGRRYYSVFVGVAALALTLLALEFFFGEEQLLINWLIAILIGAVVAYVAPRFADVALPAAGFFLGGFVINFLLVDNGRITEETPFSWAAFFIGAAMGAYSVRFSRDRSLIVLSSLTGAALITEFMAGSSSIRAAAFSGLAAVGMLYQSRNYLMDEDKVDIALIRLREAFREATDSLTHRHKDEGPETTTGNGKTMQ